MKAVKILLEEEEVRVIDLLIEELVKATKIRTTRTAIVSGMFRNGIRFYTAPEILGESVDALTACLEASTGQNQV